MSAAGHVELFEPAGAFERIESWLRERGFFQDGGEDLVADLYLGYGLSQTLRRQSTPPPPEPCALPLAACSIRPSRSVVENDSKASIPHRRLGADVGAVRIRRRRHGGPQRNRPWRRLPGQPRPAPFGAVSGRPRPRLPPPWRPSSPTTRDRSAATAGRSSPRPRSCSSGAEAIASGRARSRAPAPPAAAASSRPRQGRCGARDDRRSRAQRSLARLCGRQRAVAGADDGPSARRRGAHGLDGGGHAPRRGRAGGAAHGDLSRGDRSRERRRSPPST